MRSSLQKRLKLLENKYEISKSRKIARIVYDPNICAQDGIPHVDADVIICLPDNGHRLIKDKSIPPEGYLVLYHQ